MSAAVKLYNIALVFYIRSSVTSLDTGINDACDAGWSEFDGGCYLHVQQLLNWNAASDNCMTYGARLAEITNADENEFVKELARKSFVDVWINGQDTDVEGVWRWASDNRLLVFTDLHVLEPNQLTTANCLGMFYPYNFQWDDYHCWSLRYSICEKQKCVKRFLHQKEKAISVHYLQSPNHTNIIPAIDILWTENGNLARCSAICTMDDLCSSFFYSSMDEMCYGYESAYQLGDMLYLINGTRRYVMDKCTVE